MTTLIFFELIKSNRLGYACYTLHAKIKFLFHKCTVYSLAQLLDYQCNQPNMVRLRYYYSLSVVRSFYNYTTGTLFWRVLSVSVLGRNSLMLNIPSLGVLFCAVAVSE